MKPIVLDSNVVLGWLLNDSVTVGEDQNLISELVYKRIKVMAPSLLILEVVNACYWRHHLSTKEIAALLQRLADLEIEYENDEMRVFDLVKLVGSARLSAYDAWYLHLTMVSDGVLITHDKALLKADPRWCLTPEQWLKQQV
jgi:predicted nucleic acid-binding protein